MDGNTVKIGFVKIQEAVVGIANDGSKDGLCRLNGVTGDVFSIVMEKLIFHGFRCTVTEYDALGNYQKESGSYTGATGAVQTGDIAFLAMPAYYPLIDTNNDFVYTPTLYEDTMTMLSGYRTVNTSHTGDLFTMFTQVPYGLWIGYFISFLTFILVTFAGSRILMKKYSSLWMTTCAFLDQDNFPTDSLFVSVLSTVVMTGMFFMMTYAGNCMSTDLVTMDEPIIITSYDQMIEKNITFASAKVLPEWETLVNARKGSKEQIMFENSVALDLTPGGAMRYQSLYLNQKVVLVARPLVTLSAALLVMALPGWPSEGRFLLGSDEQAQKHTNVFIINSKLKGTPAERLLSQIVGRLGEHGFAHYVQERSAVPIVGYMVGDAGTLPSQQLKVTSRIEQESSDVVAIGWEHVYSVLIMLGSGIGLAAICLLAEIVTKELQSLSGFRKTKKVMVRQIEVIRRVNSA